MDKPRPCVVGNKRCLCANCTSNAIYEDCKKGFCANCFECEDEHRQVHDVYLCTGHEERSEEP